jgi:hypothetical protein
MPSHPRKAGERATYAVPDKLFQRVYDSPRSLPGKHVWLTPDADVREIERQLGIEEGAIGAPLWLSGDTPECRKCGRATSWLDIVSSALGEVHTKELLVRVILGGQKFVNVEAPEAIAGLKCHECGTEILDLRSFRCHNWAYAVGDLAKIVEDLGARS